MPAEISSAIRPSRTFRHSRRFDWSRPAFLIGFVLATQAENYSYQAFQIASFKFRKGTEFGLDYIFTPIVLVLIVITAVSVVLGIRQAKAILPEGKVESGRKRGPLAFLLAVIVYFAVSFLDAMMIDQTTDMIFPATISGISLIASLILLVGMMRAPETDPIFSDREASGEDSEAPHGLWSTLAWFGGLLVLASLFGFIIALAIFLTTFLKVRAGLTWTKVLLYASAGIAFMLMMANLLNRDFPPGLLQSFVDLPWPFR